MQRVILPWKESVSKLAYYRWRLAEDRKATRKRVDHAAATFRGALYQIAGLTPSVVARAAHDKNDIPTLLARG